MKLGDILKLYVWGADTTAEESFINFTVDDTIKDV